MAIRSKLPWPLRAIFFAGVIGLGGAIAMWSYDLSRGLRISNAGDARKQLIEYQEQIEKLSAERDQYSTTANAAESQINIANAAQKQMAAQVKALGLENAALKEDLAFFESLLPNATGAQGIAIRRLKIDLIAPMQLRYRLLIMQGGKGDHDFSGDLQLAVTVLQDGKNAMIVFPEGNSTEQDKFKLSFKHYQRVEGVLTLPDGASVKLVQARVLEKGQTRAQQSANL
jgi:primosomal protein N'